MGGRISQIGVEFGWRGWQTIEIEADPAEQARFNSFRFRDEAFRLQPGKDKGINWVARPIIILHGGDRRANGRCKSPMG